MRTVIKIVLVFFVFIASYYFVYWLPLSLIPGMHSHAVLSLIISISIAIAISVFAWKKMAVASNSFASYTLAGGILVGAISFVAGFFGPIIFTPGSNQGPLLGIFITGPIGFIAGLIGGAVYWKLKRGELRKA